MLPTIIAIAVGAFFFGLSQAVTTALFRSYPRGGCVGLIIAVLIGVGGYVVVTKWQQQADATALRSMTDEQLSLRVLSDIQKLDRKNSGVTELFKLPSYQEALKRGALDRSVPDTKLRTDAGSASLLPQAQSLEPPITPDVERDPEIEPESKEQQDYVAGLRKQEEEDVATIRNLDQGR